MDKVVNNYLVEQPSCGNSFATQNYLHYQEKIEHKWVEGQMDVNKQQAILNQRYEFEKCLLDLKTKNKIYNELLCGTVYKAADGSMVYSVMDADGDVLRSKVLLNTKEFETCMYYTSYPVFQAVLMVSLNKDEKIFFNFGKDGISPNFFLKKFLARGINILVSKKAEGDASKALLSYSINYAKYIQLPFAFGWCKYGDGVWHFAKFGELTMQEVVSLV